MSFLKNPIVWSGALLLVLLTGIWFGGPVVGLSRLDFRIFAVLVSIVLWIVVIMIWRTRSRASSSGKDSADLPGETNLAMPKSSEKNDDVDAFRAQLERAIQWLRGSKLAKSGQGGDVVYQLPWYLLLGDVDSGKTTWVARSGLSF